MHLAIGQRGPDVWGVRGPRGGRWGPQLEQNENRLFFRGSGPGLRTSLRIGDRLLGAEGQAGGSARAFSENGQGLQSWLRLGRWFMLV